MKDKMKKILSIILCIVMLLAEGITYPVLADNDTSHNSESFVAGGGYIYFGGWAVCNQMRYVVQYPSSIYRAGDMHNRADLANIPNAYAYSGVIGMKSGTYSGEGNQFVLVCYTMEGNAYRVVDIPFTVTKPHVVLDKQGGSGGTESFDVEFGDYPGTITVPSKENCEFLGYYTSSNGRGTKYFNGDGTPARTWGETGGTSNTPVTTYTLYACWRAHTADTAVIENFQAPTCVTGGGYDKVQYCKNILDHNTTKNYYPTYPYFGQYTEISDYAQESIPIDYTETTSVTNNVCHHELSRTHVDIPARDHSPADAVKENYVSPTCTEDGAYDSVIYCDRNGCGAELSRVRMTVDAKGHKNTETIGRKNPTLTEDGFSGEVRCLDCGAVLDNGYVIPKLSSEGSLDSTNLKNMLDEDIKLTDETYLQFETIAGNNPKIVMEIISSANETLSNLREKLASGEINEQEYKKAIETVERIIEVSADAGTEVIQSIYVADNLESKLPSDFELDVSDTITDFYNRQIEALFNEDGTMDLTVTEETFDQLLNAIDTYLGQMTEAILELKQCSKAETVTYVKQVISSIAAKSFRDFDKEAADEEFAQNAYNAVLIKMQTQVKTMLTDEYESALNSKKYKGTAKNQLAEKFESEMTAIDDLASFEIMVTEVMRQKYVSVLESRLRANTISKDEYQDYMSFATDVDIFAPVYKDIFRAWALGLDNQYGISLEELTKETIDSAKASISPDTYKEKNGKNKEITISSASEVNSIFKLAEHTNEKSETMPSKESSPQLLIISSGTMNPFAFPEKRRSWQ